MKSIKNWKSFNESVVIKKIRKVPEITSLDSSIFKDYTSHRINRELTENELKLVDEYASKFEKVFLLTEEDIKNLLLDIDLINTTTRNLDIDITRYLVSDGNHGVDFNARKEINNIDSFISLKRYYDNYTNKLVTPIDKITITNKSPTGNKIEFDHLEVYKYLEMIKGTIEDMCKCEVELDNGGTYQLSFKIIYPKTIIK